MITHITISREMSSSTIASPANDLVTLLLTGHPILGPGLRDRAISPTAFDNRKSWDNWSKTGGGKRFDNRPTWDNWKKR